MILFSDLMKKQTESSKFYTKEQDQGRTERSGDQEDEQKCVCGYREEAEREKEIYLLDPRVMAPKQIHRGKSRGWEGTGSGVDDCSVLSSSPYGV